MDNNVVHGASRAVEQNDLGLARRVRSIDACLFFQSNAFHAG